jgi:hypothetical protein
MQFDENYNGFWQINALEMHKLLFSYIQLQNKLLENVYYIKFILPKLQVGFTMPRFTYWRLWMLGTMHLWGTLTILGYPVVPEVWILYAIFHSSELHTAAIHDVCKLVTSLSQSAIVHPWTEISLQNVQWWCWTCDSEKIQRMFKHFIMLRFLSWFSRFKYVNAEP